MDCKEDGLYGLHFWGGFSWMVKSCNASVKFAPVSVGKQVTEMQVLYYCFPYDRYYHTASWSTKAVL